MNYHNSHHTNLRFHIYAAGDDDDDDVHIVDDDGVHKFRDDVHKFGDDDFVDSDIE